MKMHSASILIVESHPLMREALCLAIEEEGWQVAAQASDGAQALELLPALQADLVLFALGNPGVQDMQTLAVLHQAWPSLPILALTANEVPGQELAALQNGAQAVLSKASSRNELLFELDMLWQNKNKKLFQQGEVRG